MAGWQDGGTDGRTDVGGGAVYGNDEGGPLELWPQGPVPLHTPMKLKSAEWCMQVIRRRCTSVLVTLKLS